MIVAWRIASQIIQKRNQRIRQEIESQLFTILAKFPSSRSFDSLKPYVRYPEIFTRVLIDLRASMKGDIRERMKDIFDDLLKDKIRRDIYSRKRLKRLKAVRPFVIFSGPSDFEIIMIFP
ncbi:hypothetical protein KGY73_11005, partial [bacterium]|nr:hypothetical protein [bacterium]